MMLPPRITLRNIEPVPFAVKEIAVLERAI